LAAAGDSGRARDQLLLLFWPDATQARARHSLEQLVYAIRGSVDEEIFDGVNPVRLNNAVVSSDVGDFNDAVKRSDYNAAVSLYTGPFLDGFYLNEAPEFEQWLESERQRLAQSYGDALGRLAKEAEDAKDFGAVVEWRRKLADADPLSSRNALGLIKALANSGDRAAALMYADQYQSLVAKQLNTTVGSEIRELVALLREQSGEFARAARSVESRAISPPVPSKIAERAAPQDAQVIRRNHSTRLLLIGLAALIIAVGIIGWMRNRADDKPSSARSPRDKSIAVLPFSNISGNPDDAALGDGLTEAMIGVLARIPDLRVLSRTSTFMFRNSRVGAKSIGDSLGVTNLLEGSVLKDGTRLRVQVRLVDARDGSTQWTETYERNMKDVFAVQSEIASAVADQLDLRLRDSTVAQIKQGSTSNVAAYELYLRGNDPALTRSDSAARAGLEYFKQAIALDPNFAAAYAGATRMQLRLGYDRTQMSRTEQIAAARAMAAKALALDPSLADAHASMSFVLRADLHFAESHAELQRAVALEPANARLHEWLSQNYIMMDRPADAMREASMAMRLDPLSPTAIAEVAHAQLASGHCDQALDLLSRLQSLRPPLLRAAQFAARCYSQKSMWPQAIAELQKVAAASGPAGQAQLAFILAQSGRKDEARKILDSLIAQQKKGGEGVVDIALIYAGLGERDRAFEWLDKRSGYWDPSPNIEMLLDNLRDDPRIEHYREYIGLQKR
jgi:TolB-like protein/DNA-binding SARP family transcriptional activator/Tfp pilus assembly protein PilF